MDRVDESRIWRTAICILSTTFLDAGSGADADCATTLGTCMLRTVYTDAGRMVCLFSVEKTDQPARGPAGGGLLCGQSQRSIDQLCAQRFRGAVGVRNITTAPAGSAQADGPP